ncbi:hypothetical protein VOLCADRAFT_86175 [Volvox carteri f. nagariensis]|uniref:Uncharacterized protein n=1 Tax=Volvox carteri f. nagariensis TaxID=3068 RepID=D8TI28_VOLCA|nr:uncharacterized protein VOLCADRAFT_86175 [Volvox carteri f. nagariensis]EFJ52820.1 hypothetical protein VOLCADRAFT_86175 [Volvox carteri f. nagariensis]|eukprot:XP_002945825.1 hypothetical protein VOLCADRAFT_86175 [Volvox carteri f. nagariensis]
MAEGTPRRGSTIAEKIAQFRAAGISGSPQRTTKDDAFWWQNPSPTRRGDVASRIPPRPDAPSQQPAWYTSTTPPASSGLKPWSQQPDSDARYRGIDQSPSRNTPSRASHTAAGAPLAPTSSAMTAALHRLAHEHPTLYQAVMSLERGADGRLSETALQMVNQAFTRSTAGHKLAAPPAPALPAHAATPPSHTTTTIVPQLRSSHQQQMRTEVQARAQAALAAAAASATAAAATAVVGGASGGPAAAAAAAASRSRGEEVMRESVDQLLSRYRRHGGRSSEGPAAEAATSSDRPAGGSRAAALREEEKEEPGVAAAAGAGAGASGRDTPPATTPLDVPEPQRRLSSGWRAPAGQQSQPGPHNLSAEDGAPAATPAPAPPSASRKPTAEKLQKILQLASIANQLAVSSQSSPDTANRASGGGGGGGGSSGTQPPHLQSQADASGVRRSRHGSASSSAGDLAGEPSLASLHSQTTTGTRQHGSERQIPAEAQHATRPLPSQPLPQPAAATGWPAPAEPVRAADGEPSAAVAASAPDLQREGAPTIPNASSSAAADTGAGARAATRDTTNEPTGTAAGVPADRSSGGAFEFPVAVMGTAVDSTGLMSRAFASAAPATTSAAASVGGAGAADPGAAAAAAAARRVQFSPNEPQVRLYSEGTASGTAGLPSMPPLATAPGPEVANVPVATPAGSMQPVFLLPSPTPPDDPSAPRPTHIFVPADPSLPPALVSVPGFEPLPPGSVKPQRRSRYGSGRQSPGGGSVSPPRRRSSSSSPSPPRRDAGSTSAPTAAAATAATAAAPGKQRNDVDRMLDSDSDSDMDAAGGRMPADMALETKAAEQAAAQLEREATVHTPNRLSRLLDQVAAFKRTEGERLMREGERLKMVEELKAMNIDQLSTLLGPTSELLKDISRFRDLYTGNLELVKATADEHTRAVLDALQCTGDTAQAVKQAVVESALRQQDEVMQMVERMAPPAPPPPPPRSPLLALPAQMLYSSAPPASELLNPTWWTQLLDPANRASLAGSVAAAASAASGLDASVPGDSVSPSQAVAGDLLAQQVAGLATAIRASLDQQTDGGAAVEDLSVSAITRAARQVSMTLDMAVREYIDRTAQASAPAAAPTHALPAPAGPAYPLSPAVPLGQHYGAMPPAALAAAVPGTSLVVGQGARLGQTDPWGVQPVFLQPTVLPHGTDAQQPLLSAAAAAPGHGVVAPAAALVPPPASLVQLQQVMPMQGAVPAAANMAPQLVAVQGPLPAGGASGAALLNLPMCTLPAPAVTHPVHGMMPVTTAAVTVQQQQQHRQLVYSAATQPGEGLPCRLDLQVVRTPPPLPAQPPHPPYSHPQPQELQPQHKTWQQQQQQLPSWHQTEPRELPGAPGNAVAWHVDACDGGPGSPTSPRTWFPGSASAGAPALYSHGIGNSDADGIGQMDRVGGGGYGDGGSGGSGVQQEAPAPESRGLPVVSAWEAEGTNWVRPATANSEPHPSNHVILRGDKAVRGGNSAGDGSGAGDAGDSSSGRGLSFAGSEPSLAAGIAELTLAAADTTQLLSPLAPPVMQNPAWNGGDAHVLVPSRKTSGEHRRQQQQQQQRPMPVSYVLPGSTATAGPHLETPFTPSAAALASQAQPQPKSQPQLLVPYASQLGHQQQAGVGAAPGPIPATAGTLTPKRYQQQPLQHCDDDHHHQEQQQQQQVQASYQWRGVGTEVRNSAQEPGTSQGRDFSVTQSHSAVSNWIPTNVSDVRPPPHAARSLFKGSSAPYQQPAQQTWPTYHHQQSRIDSAVADNSSVRDRSLQGTPVPPEHMPAGIPAPAAAPAPPVITSAGPGAGMYRSAATVHLGPPAAIHSQVAGVQAAAPASASSPVAAALAGPSLSTYTSLLGYTQPATVAYGYQHHHPHQLPPGCSQNQQHQQAHSPVMPQLQWPPPQPEDAQSELASRRRSAVSSPTAKMAGTQAPGPFSPPSRCFPGPRLESAASAEPSIYHQPQQLQALPLQDQPAPQPVLLPMTIQPISRQPQHQTSKRHLTTSALPPALAALPTVSSSAGHSEEVKRAYHATLAQLQAVYHGNG